ncbi:metallophosphoesterase [Phormidesmis priestleyi]
MNVQVFNRLIIGLLVTFAVVLSSQLVVSMQPPIQLLTDPFLQLPSESSVRVVWFTEFVGRHTLSYGANFERREIATTTKLSRTREDQNSRVAEQTQDGQKYQRPIARPIWRHEATVEGLKSGQRIPYRVTSVREDGQTITSKTFSLAPNPTVGTPLKILLTSDHQLKPMVPANLQKMMETIGQVDAVFCVGDLVNVADRASEWFDDNRGNAFFPSLQGRANYQLNGKRYKGGEIIQHAPLYAAIGNHEVMGRWSMQTGLNQQVEDAIPRSVAEKLDDAKSDEPWLKNHSFNTDTYEEIFTFPESPTGKKRYYATTFGDVRLVVLYATNVWRTPSLEADAKGKYRERQSDLNQPQNWGYGQHIFEPIAKGSLQYTWLESELASPAFKQAKYKVVMFHHPPHSLGENVVPPYTNPVPTICPSRCLKETARTENKIQSIRYEYPQAEDHLIRDVVPLLERSGVQLVFYGHSHLWNRFVNAKGTHFLETSNVGNSYGAYVGKKQRSLPKDAKETYAAIDNPNGLKPVTPTLKPLLDETGTPMPYIASNEITAFSILDTGTGIVSSYRFDTKDPQASVIKFDEFKLD